MNSTTGRRSRWSGGGRGNRICWQVSPPSSLISISFSLSSLPTFFSSSIRCATSAQRSCDYFPLSAFLTFRPLSNPWSPFLPPNSGLATLAGVAPPPRAAPRRKLGHRLISGRTNLKASTAPFSGF